MNPATATIKDWSLLLNSASTSFWHNYLTSRGWEYVNGLGYQKEEIGYYRITRNTAVIMQWKEETKEEKISK